MQDNAPSPSELSRYYRTADDDRELQNRRLGVGLSMAGVGAGIAVSLYQTGVIKHLPDPPLGVFDSDEVDASDYAYRRGETPDGLTMLVSYAATAALIGAGGPDRARRKPWLSLLAAGKALFDFALAAELAREEWGENRKLCAYCQAATLASAATLAATLPEAIEAVGHLRRG